MAVGKELLSWGRWGQEEGALMPTVSRDPVSDLNMGEVIQKCSYSSCNLLNLHKATMMPGSQAMLIG